MKKYTQDEVQAILSNYDLQHLTLEQLNDVQYHGLEYFAPFLPYTTKTGITIGHNQISIVTRYGIFFFNNGYYGKQPLGKNYYLTIKFNICGLSHLSSYGSCPILKFDKTDLENMGQMVRDVHTQVTNQLSTNS